MDEVIPSERAARDFRVKFPDDVMQENLAGQLWFGAEVRMTTVPCIRRAAGVGGCLVLSDQIFSKCLQWYSLPWEMTSFLYIMMPLFYALSLGYDLFFFCFFQCLAAGSSIMNREAESSQMRPLAKAVTKTIETVRNLLREQVNMLLLLL